MATNVMEPVLEGEIIVNSPREALEKLDTAHGELFLDLSTIRRLDAAALGDLEKLAAAAEAKSVKIVLRGTGVDVYKVIKLMRLAARFTFVN
jgi:anti-anti-sigma regulatory factor